MCSIPRFLPRLVTVQPLFRAACHAPLYLSWPTCCSSGALGKRIYRLGTLALNLLASEPYVFYLQIETLAPWTSLKVHQCLDMNGGTTA
jgi:hypothetical protein